MMRKLMILIAAALFSGCSDGNDLVLTLDDIRAAVAGAAFVDQNGDGVFQTGETAAPGVLAALVVEGTADTVARATTGADGSFLISDVPIGRYQLVVARGSAIGDTLVVLPLDSTRLVLAVGDTAVRMIRLAFQTVRIAALSQVPSGRRVAVEGIALNGWSTFGDSTVHVADVSGALRVLRAERGTFAAGDSVRVVGTIGTDQGRVALVDASVRVLVAGRGLPAPRALTTAAADAGQGGAGYGQAQITAAVITDTATVARDRRLTVDDGSGPLQVVMDADAGFNLSGFVPGATLTATGLLVPTASSRWQLKPRTSADITVSFPTITIAQARASEAGRRVVIEGVALNASSAFGDSTVHLRDRTGSIRTVRVPNQVAGGDSIRMLGTIAARNGQPVLTVTSASVITAGVGVGEADSVSTFVSNTAANGTLDAAQVRIVGTIMGTQGLPTGDVLLTVDDGSGRAEVLFDASLIIAPGAYVPGAVLSARGVLVPTGTGTWRLLPRNASDVSASFSSVTIAEARSLQAGKRVYITGRALNGWSTFGDSTVHVSDATGSIRVIRTPGSLVFAGDSVRVLGTVAVNAGQPVLQGNTIEVLLAGVGLPPADSLSTLGAATALNGVRDAAQARVAGRVASVQTTTTGDTHIALNDGSGAVVLRLDRDAGFTPGSYQVGDLVNARGVLVPEGFPTFWMLKPRQPADISSVPAGAPAINSYRTTWREYVTGDRPGGWTRRWDQSASFVVVEDVTAREGKLLVWSGANLPRDRWALAFDGFGDIQNQDVYTEFRVRTLAGNLNEYLMGSAAVRIAGSSADEQGYVVYFRQKSGSARDLVLATFNNGALVELKTQQFSWSEDTWYSVRLEAIGSEIRARVWARGDAEPGDWTLTVTDTRYTTGRPGVATSDVGTVNWEVWEGRRR